MTTKKSLILASDCIRFFMPNSYSNHKKDKFQGAVKFIAPRSTPLAVIFEKLEKLKELIEIGGYTVNQATLEQIFLTMTKNQRSSNS